MLTAIKQECVVFRVIPLEEKRVARSYRRHLLGRERQLDAHDAHRDVKVFAEISKENVSSA